MTQQQKLEKLIERAIDAGWNPLSHFKPGVAIQTSSYPLSMPPEYDVLLGNNGQPPYDVIESSKVIFNHDFAKALWGEYETLEDHCTLMDSPVEFYDFGGPQWAYHLMQAVISKDPIAYMYSTVFGEDK